MKNYRATVVILCCALFLGQAMWVDTISAENITINVNEEMGRVNRFVFGNNMLGCSKGWDAMNKMWKYGIDHRDGAGVWDVNTNSSVPAMVQYAVGVGMSVVRFPGGSDARYYKWQDGIGPVSGRPAIYGPGQNERLTYGLPEFLKNAQDIDAIPVFTVAEYTGTAQDAADLVEYLNTSLGNNPNGGTAWAELRAADGHPEAWNVGWFEYGNETSYGDDAIGVQFTAEQYSHNYLAYRAAMQSVDPSIKLGAVLTNMGIDDWTETVIQRTGSVADFFITHSYVPWYTENSGIPDADTLFLTGLAGVNSQLESYYRRINNLIYEITGKHVPIAVTEYNGGFVQNTPVPYRHTLGNALINAEQIRQLMHADNIALGNYWQFANSYWGMVDGHGNPYMIRPNYYPFYMYNQHFGDMLISARLENATTYETEGGFGVLPAKGVHQDELISDVNLLENLQWSLDTVAGAQANEENGVLTVQYDGTNDVDYRHALKTATSLAGQWYRLTGFISSDNLTSTEGVFLSVGNNVNKILDSDFDKGISGSDSIWKYTQNSDSTGSETTVDSIVSHNEPNSVKVVFDGSKDVNYYHTLQKNIPVISGTTYTIEGYIKTDYLLTDGSGVSIEVQDGRGWPYGAWNSLNLKGTHDWTRVKLAFTTNPDTTRVTVILRRMGGTGIISGTAWWDDVKLYNQSETLHYTTADNGRYVYTDFRAEGNGPVCVVARRAGGGGAISGAADFSNVKLRTLVPENYGATPYLSVNASKSVDGKKVFLMVVNKHMTQPIPTTISVSGAVPCSGRAWELSGSSIDATNENAQNVYLTQYPDFAPTRGLFNYGLPPHSLTALELTICDPLNISTSSLTSGSIYKLYNQPMVATGGLPPYTWSVTGDLPDGLTLNGASGEISGVPTTTGLFAFTVGVTDANSTTTDKSLSIEILRTFNVSSSVAYGIGGIITPDTTTVVSGESATFTISPNIGWHLVTLTDNGTDATSRVINGSYTATNVIAAHTVVATFAINTYTINSIIVGSGSVTPSIASVDYGASITLTITQGGGYILSGLTDNGTTVTAVENPPGTLAYTIDNVSADHAIRISFSQVSAAPLPAIGPWGGVAAAGGLVWLAMKRRKK